MNLFNSLLQPNNHSSRTIGAMNNWTFNLIIVIAVTKLFRLISAKYIRKNYSLYC